MFIDRPTIIGAIKGVLINGISKNIFIIVAEALGNFVLANKKKQTPSQSCAFFYVLGLCTSVY